MPAGYRRAIPTLCEPFLFPFPKNHETNRGQTRFYLSQALSGLKVRKAGWVREGKGPFIARCHSPDPFAERKGKNSPVGQSRRGAPSGLGGLAIVEDLMPGLNGGGVGYPVPLHEFAQLLELV